jgi:hypothetical protein
MGRVTRKVDEKQALDWQERTRTRTRKGRRRVAAGMVDVDGGWVCRREATDGRGGVWCGRAKTAGRRSQCLEEEGSW